MRQKACPSTRSRRSSGQNPVSFFAKGGRLDLRELDTPVTPASQLFEGNSVLRGPRA